MRRRRPFSCVWVEEQNDVMAGRGEERTNEELLLEIAALREDVRDLKRICRRMDDHITFVNGTYSAVRRPMTWVFGRINRMMGLGGVELPQIKDKDK